MQNINPYWIVFASLILSAIPMLFAMGSCYLKVNIVIGLIRSGLGAQQVPGTLVVVAMSTALTLYVMSPVIQQSMQAAEQINLKQFEKNPTIADLKKLYPMVVPWEDFMKKHSSDREIAVLRQLEKEREQKLSQAASKSQVAVNSEPKTVSVEASEGKKPSPQAEAEKPLGFGLISLAFLLTELRQAFSMGFVLLLPFLVIDLIVANVLVGMGMNMVSPVMISLPLKLILLVVADGWMLLSRGLILSYGV